MNRSKRLNSWTRRNFLAAFPLMAAESLQIFSRRRTSVEPSALPQGKVYVILWFQVADYILPQSDDAVKRLAAFLTRQGIRATFVVAGEKARVLERRVRRDVIGALAQHEIGYLSNAPGQHPSIAEFESLLDWQSGIEEFDRREHAGYDAVRRIFGQTPSCYGQPGASWAPQIYPALRSWGIKVYLGEGRQIGLDGKAFWYDGMLNLYGIREGEELRPNAEWSNLSDAKADFQDLYLRLSAQPRGGVVSLRFQPYEFVETQSWDQVNFARGAQPSRDDWKLPPLKSPEDSEKAFQYFENLVAYMKSFPRAEFITASQSLELLSDRAQRHVYSQEQLAGLATQVSAEVNFQKGPGYALAASEIFFLLNTFTANVIRKAPQRAILLEGTPDGPASPGPSLPSSLQVPWEQFSHSALEVADFVRRNKRLPGAVWFGSAAAPPEGYLAALAETVTSLLSQAVRPETVTIPPAHLAAAKYVADDSPATWDWAIFPPGFHAPQLIAFAKLQAWTLKPATLVSS